MMLWKTQVETRINTVRRGETKKNRIKSKTKTKTSS